MRERMPGYSFGNHGENPYGYIESEKFKKAVEALEDFNDLSNHDKVLILTTALDLKPASEFQVYLTTEHKSDLIKILSDLGVFFYEEEIEAFADDPRRKNNTPISFVISSSPDAMSKAVGADPAYRNDGKYGEAMGYPDTATAAYVKAREDDNFDVLLSKQEERNLLTRDERKFLFFRLSKEHYEKEIAWLEQLMAAVEKHAPKLYEKIINKPEPPYGEPV